MRVWDLQRYLEYLDIPKSTLYYWKHKINKPPIARWRAKPSKELAYIIGVLLGDGFLHSRRKSNKYEIEILVTDYEFAEEFSKAMAKVLGKNFKTPGRWWRRPNFWIVNYRSKAFYQWFKHQTLETLKPYIEYNKETIKYFLRGLYDSDGTNYRCKQIFLANSNLKLLQYAQHLLRKYFNIVSRGPYLNVRAGSIRIRKDGMIIKANHDTHRIAVFRRRDVERFLKEIGFSIREKQLGLPRRK
ncbi:MAG: hypothetical protein DRJ64_07210 [Thermoprotei archaeon]|nr:MAG: hypothetical protein DRJ64_07210 [Thermoprotei archaeon]